MPEKPQGPWNLPPTPQPPRRSAAPPRRFSIGLAIWLGLIAATVVAFVTLTVVFPGQLAGMDQASAWQAIGWMALVSSGLVYARRTSFGVAARNLAIWVAIGAALILGYSFRSEAAAAFERVRGELIPSYAVAAAPHALTLTASDDGHFYVTGQVNGAPVRFVVDTGASGIVLSPDDARRAGVDLASLKFNAPAETANGVGYGAAYTAPSLTVGPLRLTDVPVDVNQAPMSSSLLGMSFLKRLDSFEVHGDQMTFRWKG
ncbi:MAG TPA: TIGR02281 family clan AA aspartic protease [Caulobacteraceae bacterium]|nr:TIGR02281 family clan AA aspartic protease [Caulobacteraceae bacterium]